MEEAQARRCADGRLHLAHGPINILATAEGAPGSVDAAYAAAATRFSTVLPELAGELSALRRMGVPVRGAVAQRMAAVVSPHQHETFVTPMAAVAGAVADEIANVMWRAATLCRVIVNNGGDIALKLARRETAKARIALWNGETAGAVRITAADGVGGLATSGRHGRSHSLGIADSVTVLGPSAAAADAAATLIGNAVDCPGHPAVSRVDAADLQPDSDLAGQLVTTAVGPLSTGDVDGALDRGVARAEAMKADGRIVAAALFLNGHWRTVGLPGGAVDHRLADDRGRAAA